MKHINRALFLLLILTLCLAVLLTSCIRLRKKTDTAQSDTKPVAEAEEEEYLPETTLNTGTATKPADTEKTVETDKDGNRILQTVAGKTPMQMITATQEKLAAAKEYEIEAVTNMTFSMSGRTMDVKISQTVCNDGENAYHYVIVDGDPTESWYVDGSFYQRYYDDEGMEQKVMESSGWTLDSFLEFNHITLGADDPTLDSSDIVFTNDYFIWDGSHYVIEYSVPKDQAVNFLEAFGFDALGPIEDASMYYTMEFNVMGRLENVFLDMTATLETENGTMEITASGKEKYLGIGSNVSSVDPPADAYEYIDYGGK